MSISNYISHIWHASARINNDRFRRPIVSSQPRLAVLDLGAYHPDLVFEKFAQLVNPRITAVDIDSQVIKRLKHSGITAIRADVEKRLPFTSGSFSFVTANQIIEHILDVDTFVSEAYRVLKPGGILILSTENLSSWHNVVALVLGWQAFAQHISYRKNIGNPFKHNAPHSKHTDHHIKIFTPRGLSDLLKLHGFVSVALFGSGYIPFMGTLARLLSFIDPVHSVFIGAIARKPA